MITKKSKILVISDDPKLVNILEAKLPSQGYHVRCTTDNGEELKDVINKEIPDLVILDVLMPKLEGIELCLRIRRWCEIPIIMLSGWGTSKNKVRNLDLSSDSYLSEPIDVSDLMVQIDHTIYHN